MQALPGYQYHSKEIPLPLSPTSHQLPPAVQTCLARLREAGSLPDALLIVHPVSVDAGADTYLLLDPVKVVALSTIRLGGRDYMLFRLPDGQILPTVTATRPLDGDEALAHAERLARFEAELVATKLLPPDPEEI